MGEFDRMRLAMPEAFACDPDQVHAFYNAGRRNLISAKPNAAHLALARLETALAERGGHLTLVTQNIDDLHERAGSMHVIHMHGELFKVRCIACERVSPWRQDLGRLDSVPSLWTNQWAPPARCLVWGDAAPYERDLCRHEPADAFVAIGTSGSVYPAAGFVAEARALGIRTCEINLERSDNAHQFEEGEMGLRARRRRRGRGISCRPLRK